MSMVEQSNVYTDADYFQSRFTYDESKEVVWDEIGRFLDANYGIGGTVVDVGSGYGYFARSVHADRKLAVDLSRYPLDRVGDGVEPSMGDVTDLPIRDRSVDVIMASNVLEHLPVTGIRRALTEFRRVLRPDGTLFVLTPNFALSPTEYFDDFTHETVLTHRSMADLLTVSGYRIDDRIVRFLPFSAEGRLPVSALLVRLYLALPVSPFAGQSLFVASPNAST